MGRALKMVPIDFDWPLRRVWRGFLGEESTEPPAGPGFQMWETTSEGSPVSPVFVTGEKLAAWLASSRNTIFAGERGSYEDWLRIIEDRDYGFRVYSRATGADDGLRTSRKSSP